jgi:hypothetical protein
MANRITERELILPSLYLIDLYGGTISTSKLQDPLRTLMKPSGEDLDILAGRTDDKFSQKVRNLKAHDTLTAPGYAKFVDGQYRITQEGQEYLKDRKGILTYMFGNDFDYETKKSQLAEIEKNKGKDIEVFDENVHVQEGIRKIQNTPVYERSQKLRQTAIEHFTKNGAIKCKACSFDFFQFYGKKGEGFIEIHHIKPVFKYSNEDMGQYIITALNNLAPVCSNCHRMIHRNWADPIMIDTLIQDIKDHGTYNYPY